MFGMTPIPVLSTSGRGRGVPLRAVVLAITGFIFTAYSIAFFIMPSSLMSFLSFLSISFAVAATACYWSAFLTWQRGHLVRVELYMDKIIDFGLNGRPTEIVFSKVSDIYYDGGDVILAIKTKIGLSYIYSIDQYSFSSQQEACMFADRAKQLLEEYRFGTLC
jgi:hypothetical protein